MGQEIEELLILGGGSEPGRYVASVTGGRYLQARDLTQLQAVFAELDAATPQLQETLQFQPRTPLYAYPLALALGLLLLQLLPGRSRRVAEEG